MRRRQIRKKDSSSDSSEEDNTAQCESAIAALKAKRAPGVKARKPASVLATSDEASTAMAEPTVAAHPEPRPPFASTALIEKTGTRATAEAVAKPRAEASARAANASTLPRRSRDALVDIEAAVGFEPLPEFIPLDMSRRGGTAQPHGRSKLEAMVYPSSSEDSADDAPAVVSEKSMDGDVDLDNLDAVRKQLKGRVTSRVVGAPASGTPSSLAEGQSLHSLLDKYASMLAKTQSTLEQDARALLRASQEASSAGALVAKLDAELSAAASHFEFFQENRRWTRSLCGFLTTKSVELTSLETEMDLAASDCAIDSTCRHAADLLDEVAECAARGDERLLVVGALPDEPPEVPPSSFTRETGMVLSAEARLLKRRARQRKAAVVLGHGPSLVLAAAAGDAECAALSECEHSDSEVSDARLRIGRIRSKRDTILADVLPEYADMATVCQRLSVWKRDFGQSFEDAYVSMSLADVFSLYVRMELLDWQPCLASCQLPSFNWFNVLWGLTETGGDDKLIPNIVSTAVIPRLCAAVRTAWNPFSRSQTHALKASVQELMDVEPSGDAIQTMVQAILTKLRVAVDDVCVPLFVRVDTGHPALSPLSMRQYLRGCKLLKLISTWDIIATEAALVELGTNQLLNAKLLVVLQCLIKTAPLLNMASATANVLCLTCESVPTLLLESKQSMSPLREAILEFDAHVASVPQSIQHRYATSTARVR